MNKYLKSFLQRGISFAGFGPIITSIVFLCVSHSIENFSLTATQIFIAIISTYILAFVQAGVSVFNQIESWPTSKSLLCHLGSLYITYILCYLINSWIPFDISVILIFTAIFVATYFIIWLSVYFVVRSTSKKINSNLPKD
jgi:hypothetical protein